MTEEMNDMDIIVTEPEAPDPRAIEEEKRSMRRCFSRCGWGTFVLVASGLLFALLFTFIIILVDPSKTGAVPFYNKNLLLFNELFVALSTLCGAIVLLKMPKAKPEHNKMSLKSFLAVLCICFCIGAVGNVIGNIWLTVWNGITGNDVTNELAEILASISPWQMILCTAVLAPILEELFFRKLLIDRMNKYGELAAIVISALLFGLFHQNFSQFFYAFGLGLVFGYVYCRTGSYLLVTLFHMVFNFVSGVLPTLLSGKVLAFADEIAELTETELVEMLPTLVGDYGVPLLLYFLYLMAMGALNIAGFIILIINFKKINVKPSGSVLNAAEQRKSAVINVGMIVAGVALIALMIVSLFPQ